MSDQDDVKRLSALACMLKFDGDACNRQSDKDDAAAISSVLARLEAAEKDALRYRMFGVQYVDRLVDKAEAIAAKDAEIAELRARVAELEGIGSVCATARDSLAEMDKIAGDLRAEASELNGLLCAANIRIAELERAQQWRPIEEAPRDGRTILAIEHGEDYGISGWWMFLASWIADTRYESGGCWKANDSQCVASPSYFASIPEPPK